MPRKDEVPSEESVSSSGQLSSSPSLKEKYSTRLLGPSSDYLQKKRLSRDEMRDRFRFFGIKRDNNSRKSASPKNRV
jgi:hypothetical protein